MTEVVGAVEAPREAAVADDGIETPVLRVAVLRSESETLHNPAWDPIPAVKEDLRWRVELFAEHDFRTFLEVEHDFDCVVLGHNVLARRPEIAEAVRGAGLTAGVVVLQQKALHGGLEFEGDLAFDVADFEEPASAATVAAERDPRHEILLIWPCPVATDEPFACESVRGLVLPEHSPWRVVLEARSDGRTLPVLVRSAASAASTVVVTSLLLESQVQQHRRLMRNIVSLAASGRPQTIVLAADRAWRGAVARKLRLRGLSALAIAREPGVAPRFDAWPLRGVGEVFVRADEPGDAGWLDGSDLRDWLAAGGRLIQVGDDGRTETTYHALDVYWVTRRLAGLLHSSQQGWERSILATRALLTLLTELEGDIGGGLSRFGLRSPEHYRPAVRSLIAARLMDKDHVDRTVSATVAVLDLDRLLPGVLTADERTRVEAWLRRLHGELIADDQLDVARALGDAGLFDDALAEVGPTRTVRTIARGRMAAAALGRRDERPVTEDEKVLAAEEIASSVLIAADYLSALAQSVTSAGDVGGRDSELADLAIATLHKRGVVAGGGDPSAASVEDIAVEARAIRAISALDPTAVGIAEPAGQLPPGLVDDVLRETARLRTRSSADEATIRRMRRSLAVAQHVFAIVGLLLAAGMAYVLTAGIKATGDLLAALTILATVTLLLAFVLDRMDLLPPWAGRAIAALKRLWESAKTATWQRGNDGPAAPPDPPAR